MKEETKKTTEEELTRRHFLKGGTGAVLVASCLPALDLPGTTTKARASQNEPLRVQPRKFMSALHAAWIATSSPSINPATVQTAE